MKGMQHWVASHRLDLRHHGSHRVSLCGLHSRTNSMEKRGLPHSGSAYGGYFVQESGHNRYLPIGLGGHDRWENSEWDLGSSHLLVSHKLPGIVSCSSVTETFPPFPDGTSYRSLLQGALTIVR